MTTHPRNYKRLAGTRGGIHSLWLADDHLLLLSHHWFSEEYRRFFFRDIQQISVAKTHGAMILNIVLGLFILLLAGAIPLVEVWQGLGVWIALAALLGVFNLLKGPSCVCELRTAVQTVRLKPLRRLRRAQKVLTRLRPLIEAAQGGPATSELITSGRIAPQAPAPAAATATVQRPLRHCHGRAHLILFWLCLADLPLTAVAYFNDQGWMDALGLAHFFASVGFAIAALVQQQHSDLPSSLKRIPILVLVSDGFFLVTGIGYTVFLISAGRLQPGQNIAWQSDPFMLAMTAVSTSFIVACGLAGLVLRKKSRFPPAAPPPAPPSDQP
ncbi:MAG: hypothetical protein N2689_04445 [Verrucomicrobiae bacterium]|nr:hypothetical protein [Verrucomicrobiae bacterium]